MEIVKSEIPIHDNYRIVKLPKDSGMNMITDINGKKQFVEDRSYANLFVAQMLIGKNWNFISEGYDPLTKKPKNPKAFKTMKECEQYILDFHTDYARKVKQSNKNI